jgi:hypothetical protein
MKKKANSLNLVQRAIAPSPRFFRVLARIGVGAALVSGAMLAPPLAPVLAAAGMPLLIPQILASVGVTAGLVSKLVVDEDALNHRKP